MLRIENRNVKFLDRKILESLAEYFMHIPRAAYRNSIFALLRRLRTQGHAIVYISHFLEEVTGIADTYTVLRDGGSVGSGEIPRVTAEDMLNMAFSMMSNRQKQKFKENAELDMAYGVAGLGRFRVNVFQLINGLGALATTITLLVVGVSKFGEGAWIVVMLIPVFVLTFQAIQRHYLEVGRELTLRGLPPSLKPLTEPRVVLPISGVHRGVLEALRYARSISDNVTAVYVEVNPIITEKVRREWETWAPDVPLVIIPSPYRSTIGPLLEFLEQTDREHNDGLRATVVLPEFIPAHWWEGFLHNRTAARLRRSFERHPNVAVVLVPYLLDS